MIRTHNTKSPCSTEKDGEFLGEYNLLEDNEMKDDSLILFLSETNLLRKKTNNPMNSGSARTKRFGLVTLIRVLHLKKKNKMIELFQGFFLKLPNGFSFNINTMKTDVVFNTSIKYLSLILFYLLSFHNVP